MKSCIHKDNTDISKKIRGKLKQFHGSRFENEDGIDKFLEKQNFLKVI